MARPVSRIRVAVIGLIGALAAVQAYAYASKTPAQAELSAQRPLEILPSGHPVVLVGLDGLPPKRFVLDTAASTTSIMPRLRTEMPEIIAKSDGAPLHGASGSTEVETTIVDRVHVAGRTFRKRELLLLPPGPTDKLGTDGILGADIVADYVVEIDMAGRRWRMTEAVEPDTLAGIAGSAPFVLDDQRAPRLTVRLNGMDMPAVLDTGARGTIVNWAAARAIGLSLDSPGVARATDIKGASNHATASIEAPLDEVAIGAVKIANPRVRVADLPVFKVLGFKPEQPAVILGIDMFADRRFVIDHPGLRLHIAPPSPRAIAA